MNASQSQTVFCARETCHAPETACVLGKDLCEHLDTDPRSDGSDALVGPALPWSGLALGLNDLAAVTATGRHRLVALVGLAEAGKTTALAAHWIAARRGSGRYGRSFAGSFTLAGWHQIARHLQWVPFGSGGFPPHTSAADNRTPSLLHMVLRAEPAPVHVIYTDVPGEWYRAWAYDVSSVPGAGWIADSADAFVIVADSEALAGERRGEARGDYEALAERLASIAGARPVVPVRAKADLEMPASLLEHIEVLNRRLFGADTTPVSVHERANAPVTEALDRGVVAAMSARRTAAVADGQQGDVLLAYRAPTIGGAL